MSHLSHSLREVVTDFEDHLVLSRDAEKSRE